ncbi:MAG: DoxX family membrane protein [Desulfobacteraceae bacterium]|nr:MAG: DoxX family membrane protein [Desulfobacteraceae bacterium]
MHLVATAARLILGAAFVYASWDKILDPAAFAEIIANYQILPPEWTNAAALLLPWVELSCAVCLISGRLLAGSALMVALLMIIFMGALAVSLLRGLDIHCGCFSNDPEAGGNLYVDLFRDVVFLAMAVMILLRSSRSAASSEPSAKCAAGD